MKVAFVLLAVVAVASAQRGSSNGFSGRDFREDYELDSRRNGVRDQFNGRRGGIDYNNDRNGDSRGFRQGPGSQDEYENEGTGFGGRPSPSRLHNFFNRLSNRGGPIRDYIQREFSGRRGGSDNRRGDRRQPGGVGADFQRYPGEGRGNRRQPEGTDSVKQGAVSPNTSGEQATGPQDNGIERAAQVNSAEQVSSQGNGDGQSTVSKGTTSGEASTRTNGNGSEGSN